MAGSRQRLAGFTPGTCPEFAGELARLAVRFKLAASEDVATDGHKAEAGHLVGAALALLLHQHGWVVDAPPGDDIIFRRDSREYRVFGQLHELVTGKLSGDAWRAAWPEADLLNTDLGALASTLSTAAS